MILIDNYDSFTYNIVQYLQELGVTPTVFENDKITIEELKNMDFDEIILSPGAGNPDTARVSMEVIKEFYKTKKILQCNLYSFSSSSLPYSLYYQFPLFVSLIEPFYSQVKGEKEL